MKIIRNSIVLGLVLAAGAATAQDKPRPTNPAVQARVEVMDTIRRNTAVLGDMASGKSAFDAAAAQAAQGALADAAGQIAVRFEAPETDPASEARPEIWHNWDDFVTRAEVLVTAAEALDASDLGSLQAGMRDVGGTCRACHSDYRM